MNVSTGQLLSQIPMFAGLAPQVLAPLQMACRSVRLERGDILFHRGDKGHEMYIIESGKMRIWMETPDGRELELAEIGENEVLGELEIIDGKSRSASAQAMVPTRLIALPREAFFTQMGNYPGMAVHLLTVLSERLRQNNERQLMDRATYTDKTRLVKLLLLLSQETQDSVLIQNPDPQLIGELLGISTAQVDHFLDELAAEGSITRLDAATIQLNPALEVANAAV